MEATQCLGGREWSEAFMSLATSSRNMCSLANAGTTKPGTPQGGTRLPLAYVWLMLEMFRFHHRS